MSLLEHPEAQALLADAVVTPAAVRGCQADRLTGLPATLPARFLPRRATRPRHPGHPGPAQRPGAQDLRADRHPGRAAPQAGAALRRRRRLGRRGGHGRTAPPRRRGAGRPRRRSGPGPQRLPQEGHRLLRRGPPVVRPAGQGRQLPGRRLPRLRRPRRLCAAGPAASTCPRTGPPTPAAAREVPRPRGGRVPGEVADRPGPARPQPPGLPHGWVAGDDEFGRASRFRPRLRRRGERYVLDVPCNTLVRDLERRARHAVGPAGPQARGAVPPGRRLGGAAAGVAVDPDRRPRRGEGPAARSRR